MALQPAGYAAPLIDRDVWLACAAPISRLPEVGSQVYYIPYGHDEQCPTAIPAHRRVARIFPCIVHAVYLSGDGETDEPYAIIYLVPGSHRILPPAPEPNQRQRGGLCYFVKQLSQSDVNSSSGFAVSSDDAERVLPRLNYDAEMPVQGLLVRDMQGRQWVFSHIWAGTPRRHMLCTEWSTFVKAKRLVAGDTVVFMCRPNGEFLVGVRRSPWYGGDPPRDARARVPIEEVEGATRLAAKGAPFSVTYYPRYGAGEFVVPRKEVEEGSRTRFAPGMRVRMVTAADDDASPTEWANGTIQAVSERFAWRMLKVKWATSKLPIINTHVNPWQVQLLERSPSPPPKRIKIYETTSSNETKSMMLFGTKITVPVQTATTSGASEILGPRNGSSHSNSVSVARSKPPEMRTIKLFGATITAPVEIDASAASEQVNQAPHDGGVADEMDTDDRPGSFGAASTHDLLSSCTHNENGARGGA